MQIDAHDTLCPACGAAALERVPVLHHMICAYVGPQYDFTGAGGLLCPKCRRAIVACDPATEIVGTAARCAECGKEMLVTPEAAGSSRPLAS